MRDVYESAALVSLSRLGRHCPRRFSRSERWPFRIKFLDGESARLSGEAKENRAPVKTEARTCTREASIFLRRRQAVCGAPVLSR